MSSKPVVVKAKRASRKAEMDARKAEKDAKREAIWARINLAKAQKAREEEAEREAKKATLEARINDYEARFAQKPQLIREFILKFAIQSHTSDNLDVEYHKDHLKRKAELQALKAVEVGVKL
jgi:hypothetical protein